MSIVAIPLSSGLLVDDGGPGRAPTGGSARRQPQEDLDMRAPLKPEDTFAVEPAGPVPYSAFQVFGIFLIAFFPLLAVVACGLRVYSRRLSTGLGWGEHNAILTPAGLSADPVCR